MTDIITSLIIITPLAILVGVFFLFVYASYKDKKNPPPELQKTWKSIYPHFKGEWDRGQITLVYHYVKDNQIIGKVVKQDDGLYRASMWNGVWKDCIYEHEAIKAVEEYKPRVYK